MAASNITFNFQKRRSIAMSFNKIILVGNLGRDPELRYTPQGTAVCSFTMATNERRKTGGGSGEPQDVTTWFRITIWGARGETASKYLTKGSPVYIEGRLRLEEWTDRDGKVRQTLDVQATDMQFIGSNRPPDEGGNFGGGARGGDEFDQTPRYENRQSQQPASRQSSPAASSQRDDFDDAGASDDDIPF
jgi:single-strand DNA-binding protein